VPGETPAEDASELAAPNLDYAAAYRLQQRQAQGDPPEPLRLPPPLNQLPWGLAKDQFGAQGAEFIGVMGALLVRTAKDQFRAYVIGTAELADTSVPQPKDPFAGRAY